MKTILLFIAITTPVLLPAQPTTASDIVEGGKTLIELFRVIKPPRVALSQSNSSPDSCSIKKKGDISYKNRTDKTMIVSLYFRVGNDYEQRSLSLRLSPSSQESLYDVRSGIYKYKIEEESNGQRTMLHEGELKLAPCEKLARDIKS